MNNRKPNKVVCGRIACILSVLLTMSLTVDAQVMPESVPLKGKYEVRKPFIDRWAFKTNALEWILTVPNFGVEFDLSSSDYNRSAIGFTAKYNWNTSHSHLPYMVFDLLDVRPEYRYYFRTLGNKTRDNGSKVRKVKYLGAYADYGEYSFKFSKEGIQGRTVGLGVSYGYALPVYQYRKGALDVDLGFSVGVQMTGYDVFSHDEENNCYSKIAAKSTGWHFTPFPVVSELRVSFAWRLVSVKDKYVGTDPKKRQISLAESDIEMSFADIRKNFDDGLDGKTKELYASDSAAYRAGFVDFVAGVAGRTAMNMESYDVGKSGRAALLRKIKAMQRKEVKRFDRSMNKR